MQSTYNNAWMDQCWVTISKKGGSEVNYSCKTRDITIGGGEKGLDMLNVNCGQIARVNRQEMFEITFDNVLPVFVDEWRYFKEGGTTSTQPKQVTSGQNAGDMFRIGILWANTNSVTAGFVAVTASAARRVIIKDCFFTGFEENWTDQLLEGNATFQVPAMDLTGGGNIMWESSNTTSSPLPSMGAYTGGNFK